MEIRIFGTQSCPNCDNVKRYLETQEVGYDYMTIGTEITQAEVSTLVGEVVRAAPVITVDGKLNSFPEMKAKVEDYLTERMLKSMNGMEL